MSTVLVTSAIKSNAFKNVAIRTYSAQSSVALKQKSFALPPGQPEVSTLGNGIVVASHENNDPISSIAILVKSGPRYETANNMGVSHYVRLCAGMRTQNSSSIGVVQGSQKMGASTICEQGRETMLYGMNINRDNMKKGFFLLSEIALNPLYADWEIKGLNHTVRSDLAGRDPMTISVELLHKAAFRNSGLGNSLFVPEYRIAMSASNDHGNSLFQPDSKIGYVSAKELQAFAKDTIKSQRIAIVGLGVEHSDLVKLAKKLEIAAGDGITGSAIYKGGDIRRDSNNRLAFVSVAGPGASYGSAEAASLAVAQSILGTFPGTKYGSGASNKLHAALRSVGSHGQVSAFNFSYSDAGLFGFFLVDEASKAGESTKAVSKVIKNLKVNETDVKQAIVKAKAALLINLESSRNEIELLGMQAIFKHNYVSPVAFAESLNKVTASSVQEALSTMMKGKPSMSAFGGIENVPYVDEL